MHGRYLLILSILMWSIVVVIPAQAGIHLVSCRHNTPCGSMGFFTSPAALLAGPTEEQTPLKPPPDSGSPGTDLGWEFGRILLALAVVIAAIYLLLRLARRFLPGLAGARRAADPVKSLARFPLAPKQTLHLVRCGSRLFLLGATSASINHLATIDDTTEIERILQALASGGPVLSGLGSFLNRSSAPPSAKDPKPDSLTEQAQEQP